MSSLDLCTSIFPLFSPIPKCFPSPTGFSFSKPRLCHLNIRCRFLSPPAATQFSSDKENEELLLAEINVNEEEYELECDSSKEEEKINFEEFERQAQQVVKDYSDSLSHQLKIGLLLNLSRSLSTFLNYVYAQNCQN